MNSQTTSKRKVLAVLLLQTAIIGGIAGYLVTSQAPWARYGLVGLFVFLAAKLFWDIRKARQQAR